MTDKLSAYLEKSERAVIVCKESGNHVLYCNDRASSLYAMTVGDFDVHQLFRENQHSFSQLIREYLSSRDSSFLFNVLILREDGTVKVTNLQIGYVNREAGEIFLEITEKIENEVQILQSIIDHATKPMFVLDFTEELRVTRGNHLFYHAFGLEEKEFVDTYQNSLSKFLTAKGQGDLFQEIKNRLEFGTECAFDFEWQGENQVKKWFHLDLNKQTFGADGEKLVGFMCPIDQQKQVMEQLKYINRQFDLIKKVTREMLCIVDLKTRMIVHQGLYAKQVGAEEVEENYPHCISPRVHPDDLDKFLDHAHKVLHGKDCSCSLRLKVVTGGYEWFQWDCSILLDEEGDPLQAIGTVRNITMQREKATQELLEGVKNNHLKLILSKEEFIEATNLILRYSSKLNYHALFFLDFDDFQDIKKKYGNIFGTFLLQEVGGRLTGNFRVGDLLGRVGEDEFVIFLRDVPSAEVVRNKGNSILKDLMKPVFNAGIPCSIQTSIGIATFPDHGTTYEELYYHADLALEESKRSGKNISTLYSVEFENSETNGEHIKEED